MTAYRRVWFCRGCDDLAHGRTCPHCGTRRHPTPEAVARLARATKGRAERWLLLPWPGSPIKTRRKPTWQPPRPPADFPAAMRQNEAAGHPAQALPPIPLQLTSKRAKYLRRQDLK